VRPARLVAALAFCVIAAGCLPELPGPKNPELVKPPPPPTDIRKTPHTFALGLITNRRVRTLSLEVFNTGRIRTRGEVVSALKSYHAKVRLDIPVFLVRHPEQGILLFGTGLSPDRARWEQHAWDPLLPKSFVYGQKKGSDIVAQLAAAGISSATVRWVILPFLSPETAGMVDAFPEAAVAVSEREWEWARSRQKPGVEQPLSPEVLEGDIRLKLQDISNAPGFGPFENGLDLFADGSVYLVGLPGRTPGNMGLWLNLDNGPVLLTGGAAYVIDNYLDLALPIKERIGDLEEFWRSLHIIQSAQRDVPQLIVFPGNDLTPLKLFKRADIRKISAR